jgi:hypothetical protein
MGVGRFSVILITGLMIWVSPLLALVPAVPAGGQLNFTVERDGDEIGSHRISFTQKGEQLIIAINTDISVKLPFIGVEVYHFIHEGEETWRDNKLIALKSTTDDDGTDHALAVVAAGDQLMVTGDGKDTTARADIIPASLWHRDIVAGGTILNTLSGIQMAVTITDHGEEDISAHGESVKVHHYSISGELQREVWYDSQGVLMQVRFKADDGSEVVYVLK